MVHNKSRCSQTSHERNCSSIFAVHPFLARLWPLISPSLTGWNVSSASHASVLFEFILGWCEPLLANAPTDCCNRYRAQPMRITSLPFPFMLVYIYKRFVVSRFASQVETWCLPTSYSSYLGNSICCWRRSAIYFRMSPCKMQCLLSRLLLRQLLPFNENTASSSSALRAIQLETWEVLAKGQSVRWGADEIQITISEERCLYTAAPA